MIFNSILAVVLVAVIVLNSQASDRSDQNTPTAAPPSAASPSQEPTQNSDQLAAVPSPTPQESDEVTPEPSASTPEYSVVEFALPSGNIWCTLSDQALCTIATVNNDSQWRDCNKSGYQVRLLDDGNAAVACPQDDQPTSAPSAFEEVDYGGTAKNELFTCDISETGVLCRSNEAEAGFSLARAGWQER